jgi:hypothetical protein
VRSARKNYSEQQACSVDVDQKSDIRFACHLSAKVHTHWTVWPVIWILDQFQSEWIRLLSNLQ